VLEGTKSVPMTTKELSEVDGRDSHVILIMGSRTAVNAQNDMPLVAVKRARCGLMVADV